MFDQAAELLEIKGANPFRIRAYRRAARTIENLPTSVAAMLAAEQDLSDLPGVGEDLADKIGAIVKAGKFDLLEKLKQELPGKLVEILTIPGIGPKRVKLLFEKLGVRSPEDLRRAAKKGRLQELRGFGAKLEQSIIAALDRPAPEKRRFKLSSAEAEARSLIEWLERGKTLDRIVAAGSYRRRQETVGDLDILATARDGGAAGDRLVAYENAEKVLVHGLSRTTVILRSGLQVDLRVVAEESYGAALMYFTGSKAHNIALRNLANERGWKLNEYGLFDGERRIAGHSEEETYKKWGLRSFHQSCARIAEKSRWRWITLSQRSYPYPISEAISTCIRIGATARLQLPIWPMQRKRAAIPTWPSPITVKGLQLRMG